MMVTICVASPIPSNHTLESRMVGPGPCLVSEYLATSPTNALPGDGDPHQNYYNIQVSSNQICSADDSCSAGEQQSKSFTINFSFGSNSNFKPSFFQAGFGVSESWTTGNSYTCNGDPGQTVCVFQRVAHTAVGESLPASHRSLTHVQYSVGEDDPKCGSDPSPSDPVAIMRSPNANNQGGSFYCATGTDCQYQGYDFWGPNVCAGGPQPWCSGA